MTLLAATWCEQQEIDGFDGEKALTKENLESFMKMLSFGKFNGKFDTKIEGLGLNMLVSEVQNTELKVPKVCCLGDESINHFLFSVAESFVYINRLRRISQQWQR